MSRRRGREEEPELDEVLTNGLGPSRKRRRGRRRPPVEEGAAATLSAVGPVDAEYADLGAPGGGDSTVVVNGLPPGSTVLDIKSRMEMYGSIARIRVDSGKGLGYVKYRTADDAQAAMAAAANPLIGIAFGSQKVQVYQESDIPPQQQPASGLPGTSKLLRAELPLRRHGRGNRVLSEGRLTFDQSRLNPLHNDRQIVAYDDIL